MSLENSSSGKSWIVWNWKSTAQAMTLPFKASIWKQHGCMLIFHLETIQEQIQALWSMVIQSLLIVKLMRAHARLSSITIAALEMGASITTTQMACCPGCQPPFCPGFGTGTRLPGQKPWGFCPGWQNRDKRCLTLKNFLHTTGFDPKTSYLAHGFLTNSPK